MNSSTLRRLAADHASLHTSELPPCYFFPPSASSSSIPDDLTQLTILLTGPQGTPYSQGLWKLYLKIPEDYPKSPPKATFRTRIWHPNVEENSGSVCVDTLKRDWQPKLTLHDVLVTITCLLIQPNPDSALNATAGHLLQDDYDSFARQAKLLTSIHASIPADIMEAALVAKRRGEGSGPTISEVVDQRPTLGGKSAGSSSVAMKKLPQPITSTQSAPIPQRNCPGDEGSESDESEDEKSASKENDPMLSPTPVTAQSPRRPSLVKRPLSDIPTPIEPDCESTAASCWSPSDQNVLNNTCSPVVDRNSEGSHKFPQLAESSQAVNFIGRGLHDASLNGRADLPAQDDAGDGGSRPAKRVCSEESKENVAEEMSLGKLPERPIPWVNNAGRSQLSASRKASAPSALGSGSQKGKARIGLRRL